MRTTTESASRIEVILESYAAGPRRPFERKILARIAAAIASIGLLVAPCFAQDLATVEPIEADGPQGALRGTLTLSGVEPEGSKNLAVAIILPGSGPTDRDGNNPQGVRAAPYRLLAEELAKVGVTTLRADKRGLFGSKSAVLDPNDVTISDYVSDVTSWRDVLIQRLNVKCVWLIGHSEGGLVALASANERGICGIVLLATPGRTAGDVLREQLASNPANRPLLLQAEKTISALEAGSFVDSGDLHPALLPLFHEQIQPFLIDLFKLDPIALLHKYDGPLFIVQGGRDLQVSAHDAHLLEGARPGANFRLVPPMNHVLKAVSDDKAANLASYGDPALPIAEGLSKMLAQFILENNPCAINRSLPSR